MEPRRFLKRLWLSAILRVWPLARLWYRSWGLTLDARPSDEVWYFAYGANMNDAVFLGRRKMDPLEWRVGRIVGQRLRFNLKGRPIGKAAPANLSADPAAEVWGVLYRITRRDMLWLGCTEGVPGRRYRPVWLNAEDKVGTRLPVFTYVADSRHKDGNPSLRYITLIREGAKAHGLPDHWIDHLERVEAAK